MEYIVDTENISLDYSENREGHDDTPYRMTLYDKYGHFENDVYLRKEQIEDLINGFKNEKI